MNRRIIALLGRKDEPTDAIEEYCRYLGEALRLQEFDLQIRRVPWEKHGWRDSLEAIRLQAATWRGNWVFVQYTALAWSARGFPQEFLRVLRLLRSAGTRVGILFHDVEPYSGERLVDRVRRAVQLHAMRRALRIAELAIFTVAPEKLSWVPTKSSNIEFVPVGPNLPFPLTPESHNKRTNALPTVGVFGITGGKAGARETETILNATRHAAKSFGPIRLAVFGRHAELRETDLRKGLQGTDVELSVEGVVEPAQVVERLHSCDLLLFVRGGISSRRSSAIAGIAAGLPILAYEGTETAPPVTEAGVVLVAEGDAVALHSALVNMLSDVALRENLAARSKAAFQAYFSWSAIAMRFVGAIRSKQ